ncbi:hypothetical protein [Curtobacterium flaccumfaciens]|uniref:hypothetical protein n=1 Tax=Curtobacterium flaccumfaciens TaxID=2035 RepID=UPI001AD9C678|nr:hypothetical protein [Curtobacterium flaccumfaciens]MBO9043477.1 hypothetical protein [Curtobacterium flaccumfaciens pv. flaccumfaciens]
MSTLTDALDHAHHGRRVIWLGIHLTHAGVSAGDAAQQALQRYRDDVEKVVRVNGRQSITFRSGGTIHFMSVSAPNSLRGHRADVVYLPHWHYTQDADFMRDVVHRVLATTEDPRVGVVA